MKKCLLVCFSVFLLAGCLVTKPKPDFSMDFEGFREFKWGTFVEDVRNELVFQGVDEKRKVEWFTKKNEKLKFGKADLESIGYVFQDGYFVAVNMISKGQANYEALREELEKRFGKNASAKPDASTWDIEHATILFNYSRPSEVSMLVIRAKGY